MYFCLPRWLFESSNNLFTSRLTAALKDCTQTTQNVKEGLQVASVGPFGMHSPWHQRVVVCRVFPFVYFSGGRIFKVVVNPFFFTNLIFINAQHGLRQVGTNIYKGTFKKHIAKTGNRVKKIIVYQLTSTLLNHTVGPC